MANVKPLTKQDLKEALSHLEVRLGKKFATKDDVRQIVGGEIKTRGLATKDDLKAMEKRTDEKFKVMESNLKEMESSLKDYVHQGVDTVVAALDEKLGARPDVNYPVN